MFELKPITEASIPRALAKAERYRLLNEPRDAESICRDILRADAENADALRMLLLALTDQFGRTRRVSVTHAQELLPRIRDEYQRAYCEGVVCERWAKALMGDEAPGHVVFGWLRKAMEAYERAEPLRQAGNDDAILRWNTCARIIKRHEHLRPRPEDASPDLHQDDVPVR